MSGAESLADDFMLSDSARGSFVFTHIFNFRSMLLYNLPTFP